MIKNNIEMAVNRIDNINTFLDQTSFIQSFIG